MVKGLRVVLVTNTVLTELLFRRDKSLVRVWCDAPEDIEIRYLESNITRNEVRLVVASEEWPTQPEGTELEVWTPTYTVTTQPMMMVEKLRS